VVLPERSFAIRQLIETACAKRKLRLARALEVNTLAFAQRLVKGSDAHVTFLPVDLLVDEVRSGELAALSIDEHSLQAGHVTLVASRTRKLSQAARHAAAWLEEKMQDKRLARPGIGRREARRKSA
jgi:DNA-binding transcriptional LysR family regulator